MQREQSPASPRFAALTIVALLVGVSVVALGRHLTIVPRSGWDTAPPIVYASARQRIAGIIIHHDGVQYPSQLGGRKKAQLLLHASRVEEGWEDVPYHYLVDVDGTIFTGRPEEHAGDTHTSYAVMNRLHIALMGDYTDLVPTPTQLAALRALVRAKAREYRVPANAIKLHNEVAATECPGIHTRERLQGTWWIH